MKPQCDFRVGLVGPRPCYETPTYRCICERCSSEGDSGTFFACEAHRAGVEDQHQRIYGPHRAVVWQHTAQAPVRPCSPRHGPCLYYEPGCIISISEDCPEHGQTARMRRERRDLLNQIERATKRVRELDDLLAPTELGHVAGASQVKP